MRRGRIPERPGDGDEGCVGIIHVHSTYSHDGLDSLERLRAFAIERGIDFIGLTDHAEDLTPELWDEYVERCAEISDERVRLIPGLEFHFEGEVGLHLLALGLTRWIEPRTPAEFIEQAGEAARFTVAAHPILHDYRIPDEVRDGIDAIEVWNATYNTRYLPDPRAIRVLHEIQRTRPNVVGTAALDQHDCRNDRETRVVVADRTADPLLELRAGRFVNVGRTMHFDAAVRMSAPGMRLLTVTRWALDRVERAQEWLATALRGRGGSPA
jgi:predicted metal-dependent phosphoesterase TrpH